MDNRLDQCKCCRNVHTNITLSCSWVVGDEEEEDDDEFLKAVLEGVETDIAKDASLSWFDDLTEKQLSCQHARQPQVCGNGALPKGDPASFENWSPCPRGGRYSTGDVRCDGSSETPASNLLFRVLGGETPSISGLESSPQVASSPSLEQLAANQSDVKWTSAMATPPCAFSTSFDNGRLNDTSLYDGNVTAAKVKVTHRKLFSPGVTGLSNKPDNSLLHLSDLDITKETDVTILQEDEERMDGKGVVAVNGGDHQDNDQTLIALVENVDMEMMVAGNSGTKPWSDQNGVESLLKEANGESVLDEDLDLDDGDQTLILAAEDADSETARIDKSRKSVTVNGQKVVGTLLKEADGKSVVDEDLDLDDGDQSLILAADDAATETARIDNARKSVTVNGQKVEEKRQHIETLLNTLFSSPTGSSSDKAAVHEKEDAKCVNLDFDGAEEVGIDSSDLKSGLGEIDKKSVSDDGDSNLVETDHMSDSLCLTALLDGEESLKSNKVVGIQVKRSTQPRSRDGVAKRLYAVEHCASDTLGNEFDKKALKKTAMVNSDGKVQLDGEELLLLTVSTPNRRSQNTLVTSKSEKKSSTLCIGSSQKENPVSILKSPNTPKSNYSRKVRFSLPGNCAFGLSSATLDSIVPGRNDADAHINAVVTLDNTEISQGKKAGCVISDRAIDEDRRCREIKLCHLEGNSPSNPCLHKALPLVTSNTETIVEDFISVGHCSKVNKLSVDCIDGVIPTHCLTEHSKNLSDVNNDTGQAEESSSLPSSPTFIRSCSQLSQPSEGDGFDNSADKSLCDMDIINGEWDNISNPSVLPLSSKELDKSLSSEDDCAQGVPVPADSSSSLLCEVGTKIVGKDRSSVTSREKFDEENNTFDGMKRSKKSYEKNLIESISVDRRKDLSTALFINRNKDHESDSDTVLESFTGSKTETIKEEDVDPVDSLLMAAYDVSSFTDDALDTNCSLVSVKQTINMEEQPHSNAERDDDVNDMKKVEKVFLPSSCYATSSHHSFTNSMPVSKSSASSSSSSLKASSCSTTVISTSVVTNPSPANDVKNRTQSSSMSQNNETKTSCTEPLIISTSTTTTTVPVPSSSSSLQSLSVTSSSAKSKPNASPNNVTVSSASNLPLLSTTVTTGTSFGVKPRKFFYPKVNNKIPEIDTNNKTSLNVADNKATTGDVSAKSKSLSSTSSVSSASETSIASSSTSSTTPETTSTTSCSGSGTAPTPNNAESFDHSDDAVSTLFWSREAQRLFDDEDDAASSRVDKKNEIPGAVKDDSLLLPMILDEGQRREERSLCNQGTKRKGLPKLLGFARFNDMFGTNSITESETNIGGSDEYVGTEGAGVPRRNPTDTPIPLKDACRKDKRHIKTTQLMRTKTAHYDGRGLVNSIDSVANGEGFGRSAKAPSVVIDDNNALDCHERIGKSDASEKQVSINENVITQARDDVIRNKCVEKNADLNQDSEGNSNELDREVERHLEGIPSCMWEDTEFSQMLATSSNNDCDAMIMIAANSVVGDENDLVSNAVVDNERDGRGPVLLGGDASCSKAARQDSNDGIDKEANDNGINSSPSSLTYQQNTQNNRVGFKRSSSVVCPTSSTSGKKLKLGSASSSLSKVSRNVSKLKDFDRLFFGGQEMNTETEMPEVNQEGSTKENVEDEFGRTIASMKGKSSGTTNKLGLGFKGFQRAGDRNTIHTAVDMPGTNTGNEGDLEDEFESVLAGLKGRSPSVTHNDNKSLVEFGRCDQKSSVMPAASALLKDEESQVIDHFEAMPAGLKRRKTSCISGTTKRLSDSGKGFGASGYSNCSDSAQIGNGGHTSGDCDVIPTNIDRRAAQIGNGGHTSGDCDVIPTNIDRHAARIGSTTSLGTAIATALNSSEQARQNTDELMKNFDESHNNNMSSGVKGDFSDNDESEQILMTTKNDCLHSEEYSLVDCERTTFSNDKLGGGFQTAGGNKINLSDEAQNKASALWDSVNSESNALQETSDQLPKSLIVEDEKGEGNISLRGFCTAGGKQISLSEESKNKASSLWGSVCSENSVCHSKSEQAGKQGGPSSLQGFVSAGGKKITLSDEAKEKAKCLWESVRSEDASLSTAKSLESGLEGVGPIPVTHAQKDKFSKESWEDSVSKASGDVNGCKRKSPFMTDTSNDRQMDKRHKGFRPFKPPNMVKKRKSETEVVEKDQFSSVKDDQDAGENDILQTDRGKINGGEKEEEALEKGTANGTPDEQNRNDLQQKQNVVETVRDDDCHFDDGEFDSQLLAELDLKTAAGFERDLGMEDKANVVDREQQVYSEVRERNDEMEISVAILENKRQISGNDDIKYPTENGPDDEKDNEKQRKGQSTKETKSMHSDGEDASAVSKFVFGFSTAAGNVVSVSDNALERARTFLSEDDASKRTTPHLDRNTLSLDQHNSTHAKIIEDVPTASDSKDSVYGNVVEKANKDLNSSDEELMTLEENGNKTISNRIRTIPAVCDETFCGFSTAAGSKVSVSTSALEKARSVLNSLGEDRPVCESNQTNSRESSKRNEDPPKSYIGFTTAAGSKVSVSEKALEKAKSFLNEDVTETHSIMVGGGTKDTKSRYRGTCSSVTQTGSAICESSLMSLGGDGDERQFVRRDTVTAKGGNVKSKLSIGFSTAAGDDVSTSENSLIQVKKFLNGDDDNGEALVSDNTRMEEKSERSRSHTPFIGFSTAAGENVAVSEKALLQAKKFLNDDNGEALVSDNTRMEEKSERSRSHTPFIGFSTAAGENVAVSEKALLQAKKFLNDDNGEALVSDNTRMEEKSERSRSHTPFIGFSTAAGENVAVSEKALLQAKKFFNDDNGEALVKASSDTRMEEKSEHSRSHTPFIGFSTAAGENVAVSEKALLQAKKFLNDGEVDVVDEDDNGGETFMSDDTRVQFQSAHVGHKPFIGFSTAAGDSVAVSEKALLQAKKFLNDEDDEKLEKNFDEQSMEVGKIDSDSGKFLGFSTAAGSEVSVSEEALTKAKYLWNDNGNNDGDNGVGKLNVGKPKFGGFSTASGVSVTVSKTSLKRARAFLHDDSEENAVVTGTSQQEESNYENACFLSEEQCECEERRRSSTVVTTPDSSSDIYNIIPLKALEQAEILLRVGKENRKQTTGGTGTNSRGSSTAESVGCSVVSGSGSDSRGQQRRADSSTSHVVETRPYGCMGSEFTKTPLVSKSEEVLNDRPGSKRRRLRAVHSNSLMREQTLPPLSTNLSLANAAYNKHSPVTTTTTPSSSSTRITTRSTATLSSSSATAATQPSSSFVPPASTTTAKPQSTCNRGNIPTTATVQQNKRPVFFSKSKWNQDGPDVRRSSRLRSNSKLVNGLYSSIQDGQSSGDLTDNPAMFDRHTEVQRKLDIDDEVMGEKVNSETFVGVYVEKGMACEHSKKRYEEKTPSSTYSTTHHTDCVAMDDQLDNEEENKFLCDNISTQIGCSPANTNHKSSADGNVNVNDAHRVIPVAVEGQRLSAVVLNATASTTTTNVGRQHSNNQHFSQQSVSNLKTANKGNNSGVVKAKLHITNTNTNKKDLGTSGGDFSKSVIDKKIGGEIRIGSDGSGGSCGGGGSSGGGGSGSGGGGGGSSARPNGNASAAAAAVVDESEADLTEARMRQEKIIRDKKRRRVAPRQGRLMEQRAVVNTPAAMANSRNGARFDLRTLDDWSAGKRLTRDELLGHGVSEATLLVHSGNAADYRFDLRRFYPGGVPASVLIGDGATLVHDGKGWAGYQQFHTAFLTLDGVDPNLVDVAWVRNHYRWIVWKLAAYEVNFPAAFAGRALTPDSVMLQLKYRCDREVDRAQRSAIKKIVERDDTSTKRMVLCVAGIRKDDNGKCLLEMTDGWYSIWSKLDTPLSSLVSRSRLSVGVKVITSGAELEGAVQGCPPLEMGEDVRLVLRANSTRPAPWFSCLGFQSNPMALCVPLCSLRPDGGMLGCVDVVVSRVYPTMFMEKQAEGKCVFRTQEAEDEERKKHSERKQREVEKIYHSIQVQMEEEEEKRSTKLKRHTWTRREVEELNSGEELLNAWETSFNPEDLQMLLSEDQLRKLCDHRQTCLCERQARVAQRVRESMGDGGVYQDRRVMPVHKLRLVGCCNRDIDAQCESLLTVWRPSADWCSVQEGQRYRMFHLAVSSSRRAGGSNRSSSAGYYYQQYHHLQQQQQQQQHGSSSNNSSNKTNNTACRIALASTRQTRIQKLSIGDNLLDLVYQPRELLAVQELTTLDSGCEFDFLGVALKVVPPSGGGDGDEQGRPLLITAADKHGDVMTIKVWRKSQSVAALPVKEKHCFVVLNLIKPKPRRGPFMAVVGGRERRRVTAEARQEMTSFSTSIGGKYGQDLAQLQEHLTKTPGFLDEVKQAIEDDDSAASVSRDERVSRAIKSTKSPGPATVFDDNFNFFAQVDDDDFPPEMVDKIFHHLTPNGSLRSTSPHTETSNMTDDHQAASVSGDFNQDLKSNSKGVGGAGVKQQQSFVGKVVQTRTTNCVSSDSCNQQQKEMADDKLCGGVSSNSSSSSSSVPNRLVTHSPMKNVIEESVVEENSCNHEKVKGSDFEEGGAAKIKSKFVSGASHVAVDTKNDKNSVMIRSHCSSNNKNNESSSSSSSSNSNRLKRKRPAEGTGQKESNGNSNNLPVVTVSTKQEKALKAEVWNNSGGDTGPTEEEEREECDNGGGSDLVLRKRKKNLRVKMTKLLSYGRPQALTALSGPVVSPACVKQFKSPHSSTSSLQ